MKVKFSDNCASETIGSTFTVNVNPFLTNNELIHFYYYSLWFPKYFGFNWDAFNDCMRDLEWINADIIHINHNEMINLSNKMLGFYANILNSIIEFNEEINWKKINVVFSEKQKHIILDNYNCSIIDVIKENE